MKSVFLSVLMFAIVFAALKFDILRLFDNHIIFYIAIIVVIIVISGGLYFVGIPKVSDLKKSFQKKPEDKDD